MQANMRDEFGKANPPTVTASDDRDAGMRPTPLGVLRASGGKSRGGGTMPHWLTMTLALIFFFVSTFLVTWAIREGGSFAFLLPSSWKKKAGPPHDAEVDRPRRP